MVTANVIIQNYAAALANMASNVSGTALYLNDNPEENNATIRTLNVILDSVRAETVILQSAIDSYPN